MPYPLPLTRTEAYLAYKAGVAQLSDLKPSLAKPRIGIDDWLAYWTGLKNDYPKNPDGTPKMLQEEEKYIAYLSGVTNAYPEKCLRRVGAYLRYLISARWGRPDHPLNREELYLSLIKTQFIPSGDPSSDITIDGTAKGPFQDVKMYGDTFQQTYTGKNLFNKNNPNMFVGYVGWNGGINSTSADRMIYIPCEPSTTYSIQKPIPTTNPKFRVAVSTDVPANGGTATVLTNDSYMSLGEATVTTRADSAYLMIYIWVNSSDMTLDEVLSGIQIEVGSSVTSYEPYVGGVPSPNPSYPQQIQTVTGEQTVSINGTDYSIDLGSIELCKLGTYQDYIYKDGEDWKIHKEIGKFVIDSAKVQGAYGKRYRYAKTDLPNALLPYGGTDFLCEYFTAVADDTYGIGSVYAGGTMLNFRYDENGDNIAGFRTFVTNANLSVYCQLATATDTTITDTTLIAQLDSLVNGGAENGTTYIKVSATDPNLPGLLYVEAPKYE